MELVELREQIDRIDDQLVQLFCERMSIAGQIAAYKKQHDLPIFVPGREEEKLHDVCGKAGAEMSSYTKILYSTLFELSRDYQSKRTADHPFPVKRELQRTSLPGSGDQGADSEVL